MVARIEYIEKVVATFVQAAEVNRTTPGRKGTTVVLSPELGRDLMVTGDLRGHRRNFALICRTAGLETHPRRHLLLQDVCHGGPTYPENGGCMSHTLLEDVAKLVVQFPGRVHLILGNHDLSELTGDPVQRNRQSLNVAFRLGLQHTYGPATEKVREAYGTFLVSCPLAVRLPGGIFISHSVPDNVASGKFDVTIFSRQPEPNEFYGRSSIFELVWGRDHQNANTAAFAELVAARVFINGQEPATTGGCAPNDYQVMLDCSGHRASYAILPIGEELDQAGVVQRIRRL
jgi:hypothetical protein